MFKICQFLIIEYCILTRDNKLMLGITTLNFWIYFAYFLFAISIAFYIPGNFFVRKIKTDRIVKITLSFLLGISLWGLQGFIFGYLNIREATYIYLLFFLAVWVKDNFKKFINITMPTLPKIDRADTLIILLILIGSLMQIFSIIWNFIPIKEGIFLQQEYKTPCII
jgi:hypothetical protein